MYISPLLWSSSTLISNSDCSWFPNFLVPIFLRSHYPSCIWQEEENIRSVIPQEKRPQFYFSTKPIDFRKTKNNLFRNNFPNPKMNLISPLFPNLSPLLFAILQLSTQLSVPSFIPQPQTPGNFCNYFCWADIFTFLQLVKISCDRLRFDSLWK